MIINRISTNNNFGAKIVEELKKEVKNKKVSFAAIAEETNQLLSILEKPLNDTMKKIGELLPDAKVDIDENNKSKYKITICGRKLFADRGDDESTGNYLSLIKALTHFQETYRLPQKKKFWIF